MHRQWDLDILCVYMLHHFWRPKGNHEMITSSSLLWTLSDEKATVAYWSGFSRVWCSKQKRGPRSLLIGHEIYGHGYWNTHMLILSVTLYGKVFCNPILLNLNLSKRPESEFSPGYIYCLLLYVFIRKLRIVPIETHSLSRNLVEHQLRTWKNRYSIQIMFQSTTDTHPFKY